MQQYHDVIRRVLKEGRRKHNRTGVDTLSTFNINYQIDLREGFPLLTTKEISWKTSSLKTSGFYPATRALICCASMAASSGSPGPTKTDGYRAPTATSGATIPCMTMARRALTIRFATLSTS